MLYLETNGIIWRANPFLNKQPSLRPTHSVKVSNTLITTHVEKLREAALVYECAFS